MTLTISSQPQAWQPETDEQRLLYYAGVGDCEGVQRMLDAGVDIDVTDGPRREVLRQFEGWYTWNCYQITPLNLACLQGMSEVVRVLLERAHKIDRGIITYLSLSYSIDYFTPDEGRNISLILQYHAVRNLELYQKALDRAINYGNLCAVRSVLKIACKEFGFDQKLHVLLLPFLHSDIANIVSEYHIGECPQLVDHLRINDYNLRHPLQKAIQATRNRHIDEGREPKQERREIVGLLLDSRANPCTFSDGTTALDLVIQWRSGVPQRIKKLILETPEAQKAMEEAERAKEEQEAERAKQEAERAKHVSGNTRSRKRLADGELVHAKPKARKK